MTLALAYLIASVVTVRVLCETGDPGGALAWGWRDGSRLAVALAALVGAPALAVYQVYRWMKR